ncbi:hypothetical protein ACFE04_008000 [Oxalis oulophora]
MESSSNPKVLPRHCDLTATQISYLNQHLTTEQKDLHKAASLILQQLNTNCLDVDANIKTLRNSLNKCLVFRISSSFKATTALANLNIKLENLSLRTSHYTIGSKSNRQVFDEEIPRLVKELHMIQTIHKYLGDWIGWVIHAMAYSEMSLLFRTSGLQSTAFEHTTLRLEALVGDLEDAVFSAMDSFTGKLFSGKLSSVGVSMVERVNQAVKAMKGIEEIVTDNAKFQDHWHHLLASVDTRVDRTLAVLRPQVVADHRSLLASLGWPPKLSIGDMSSIPNPLVLMQGDRRKSYAQSFLALCALQHLQTKREERRQNNNVLGKKAGVLQLWAIDELVSPIASRVEYHFLKWIEQPELIFALVYKIIRDFIVGVDDVLQPLIDRARLLSCSAKEAWVCAMVKMLSGFIGKKIVSDLVERYKQQDEKLEVMSSWLHLVDLIVAYDKRMQSLVASETGFFSSRNEVVLSVSTIFSDRTDWLKIWAKIELKEAWKRLKAELKEERAWLVGDKCVANDTEPELYLLSGRENHKAPLIAETGLKIAWEMIDRSQNLPAILSRVQFIRSSAGTFFWHFFNVLVFRCKNAFLVDNDDSLIKVCGSINASRYIKYKLEEWSDDAAFLEMRIAEIRGKDDDVIKGGNAFFAEEINSLAELETNWLLEIIAIVLRQFESLSWDYFQSKQLYTMDSVSVDFVEALDTLRNKLQLLKANINPKDFMDLWMSVADGLDHFISSNILSSEMNFCDIWVNQFGVDIQALFLTFQAFCTRPDAFFPLTREILKLLRMSKEEVQVFLFEESEMKCHGISHLSLHQVNEVLRHRKFTS